MTRKREFLEAMELVVPWEEIVELVIFHTGKYDHPTKTQEFSTESLLRLYLVQK